MKLTRSARITLAPPHPPQRRRDLNHAPWQLLVLRIECTGTFYAIEEEPIADSRSVVANLYLLPSMVEHCTGPLSRLPRQIKAEALVEEGLRLVPWDLAKTFAFSRNEEMPESPGRPICYSSSSEGEYEAGTVSGHVMIPDAEHTDLLSVLWWCPEMPVLALFIPLFTGLTHEQSRRSANRC